MTYSSGTGIRSPMKQIAEQQKEPLKLYSTNEAAKLWGITKWTIFDLVKKGTIKPVVGMGKGWKFTGFELREENLARL